MFTKRQAELIKAVRARKSSTFTPRTTAGRLRSTKSRSMLGRLFRK